MDQVYYYLGQALYYGLFVAFWISSVILLGHLLWNKQWLLSLLTIFFTWGFYYAGPFVVLGPLIALIIGWQEADKWQIKKLVRILSALMVVCFILLTRDAYVNFMKPKPKVDPAILARQRAQKAAAAAIKKK